MHPVIATFFRDYLSNEKIVKFRGRFVLNTHFPPFPGHAFNNLARHFNSIGVASDRHLYSVTLAVTNRCGYNCWHCYNAGRSLSDTPLSSLREIIGRLQDMNVVKVTLTGGEPLLRNDLERIAGFFDDSTSLVLNTTGAGLTGERAAALWDNGVFAVGISVDSDVPEEHDRMRGKKGAFDTAIEALRCASDNGLYPYVIAVATRDFLEPDRFNKFMLFAADCGALEVHLLEPCATGKLSGQDDVCLGDDDKARILRYQREIASDENLPILSSFLYLESPEAFGCGAGLTHLYIDGSGEVGPCNLIPISFGNVLTEPLEDILETMGRYFRKPRTECVGHVLAEHIPPGKLPLDKERSCVLCEQHLPKEHGIPKFFSIRSGMLKDVDRDDLRSAYDKIHESYDEFWLCVYCNSVFFKGGQWINIEEYMKKIGELMKDM